MTYKAVLTSYAIYKRQESPSYVCHDVAFDFYEINGIC